MQKRLEQTKYTTRFLTLSEKKRTTNFKGGSWRISYKKTDREYYEYYEWTDEYYEWTNEYYEGVNEYYEWEKSTTSDQASNTITY